LDIKKVFREDVAVHHLLKTYAYLRQVDVICEEFKLVLNKTKPNNNVAKQIM